MRLVSYRLGQSVRVGVVVNGQVIDGQKALRSVGVRDTRFVSDMASLLESGTKGLRQLRQAVREGRKQGLSKLALPLEKVHLLPPVPNPRKIFALAGNYAEHIREGGREVQEKDKITPRIFVKLVSALTAPGEPIAIGKVAQFVDWEAELAVVIGRTGKYIPVERALNYVAGYTCFNDVSERKLKIRERSESEEWDRFFDWLNGKWFDTFAPMGPWLVTKDEIPDPQNLRITLKVNGQLRQDGHTSQMIFTVAEIVHYLSHIVTLEQGDVIATGTPSGVGFAMQTPLKPGDVVEVEIERIGVLRNPVIAEKNPS